MNRERRYGEKNIASFWLDAISPWPRGYRQERIYVEEAKREDWDHERKTFNSLFCLDPDLKNLHEQILQWGNNSLCYIFPSDKKSLFSKSSELPMWCVPQLTLKLRSPSMWQ